MKIRLWIYIALVAFGGVAAMEHPEQQQFFRSPDRFRFSAELGQRFSEFMDVLKKVDSARAGTLFTDPERHFVDMCIRASSDEGRVAAITECNDLFERGIVVWLWDLFLRTMADAGPSVVMSTFRPEIKTFDRAQYEAGIRAAVDDLYDLRNQAIIFCLMKRAFVTVIPPKSNTRILIVRLPATGEQLALIDTVGLEVAHWHGHKMIARVLAVSENIQLSHTLLDELYEEAQRHGRAYRCIEDHADNLTYYSVETVVEGAEDVYEAQVAPSGLHGE